MTCGRTFLMLVAALLVAAGTLSGETATLPPKADPASLVKLLSGEDVVAKFLAEERLIRLGDASLGALEPLARSPGFAPERRYAIHILAQIGSPRAIALLVRILRDDGNVHVRGLVCEHLGRMGVSEAVPEIGRWLRTIRGKSFRTVRHPVVLTPLYEWMRHAHALREIGSEKGIPILEEMIRAGHGGRGGKPLVRAYEDCLRELKREAAFRKAARSVPGIEAHVKTLFDFCRTDTLARIRLYRMKLIALDVQTRWVLEGLQKHPDAKLRRAASAVLSAYGKLRRAKGGAS